MRKNSYMHFWFFIFFSKEWKYFKLKPAYWWKKYLFKNIKKTCNSLYSASDALNFPILRIYMRIHRCFVLFSFPISIVDFIVQTYLNASNKFTWCSLILVKFPFLSHIFLLFFFFLEDTSYMLTDASNIK